MKEILIFICVKLIAYTLVVKYFTGFYYKYYAYKYTKYKLNKKIDKALETEKKRTAPIILKGCDYSYLGRMEDFWIPRQEMVTYLAHSKAAFAELPEATLEPSVSETKVHYIDVGGMTKREAERTIENLKLVGFG